jgi:cytochrome P450/NADPH-cytochrome P450 reductase
VLGTRVELSTPASKRQIEAIAKTATEEDQKALHAMISSDEVFKNEVISKRMSILDILEDFPSSKLSFGAYLDMLKPLAPRQFSISSSTYGTDPKTAKGEDVPVMASITYDVHIAPARSGNGRIFRGVASNYLAASDPGSKIRCFVRPSNTSFHLPEDVTKPIIMVAAGTGIAPMRGFIQERACLAEVGERQLGPALLYYGCRDSERDFLYKDQLAEWEKLGAVTMRPTFSRKGPEGTPKYVYQRMWDDREELAALFREGGAKIFVCGSANKLARSVAETVMKIWLERNPDKTEKEAEEWLDSIREERYVTDVFE